MKSCYKKKEHCCELMDGFLKDPRIGIGYDFTCREYLIDLFSSGAQLIHYCPFCGGKLPGSLCNLYIKILQNEFGVNDVCDEEEMKKVPSEFRTDEWWKKRGL